MDQRQTLTRIRQIIARARQRRGLVTDDTLADAMLEAMRIATGEASACFPQQAPTPCPIRRKYLLLHIATQSRYAGLQDEVGLFVTKAGRSDMHGLSLEQLESLSSWLHVQIDAQQTVCDSNWAPPAR